MARATMAALIARVRRMLNNSAAFGDDDIQALLDDHAVAVDEFLASRPPLYLQHVAPVGNLETDAKVFVGASSAALVENTDYTLDAQRGMVTTTSADHRTLRLQGIAYDLHAAAADGWEQIAAGLVGAFDFKADGGEYRRSQQHQQALQQAAYHRQRAWAVTVPMARGDEGGASGALGAILDDFASWGRY